METLSRKVQQRLSSARCATRLIGRAYRSSNASSARRSGSRAPKDERLRTEATSRSISSGAASDSPRSLARARSPSTPSSASAGARTLASTTITVTSQSVGGVRERDGSASTAPGPVQDLVHCGRRGVLDEQCAQILLQRLMGGGSSPAKDSVRLDGHVFHLNARHGAILALMAPKCQQRLRSVPCWGARRWREASSAPLGALVASTHSTAVVQRSVALGATVDVSNLGDILETT